MDAHCDARSKLNSPHQASWHNFGWVAVLLMLQAAQPVNAVVELLPPVKESAPTTEDLNGIAAGTNGDHIVVGNGATVLRRTLDPDNNPIWTSLNPWAAGFFTAEILTLALSPVTYPGGDGWVIAGRETIVETDFADTLVVDQRPGSGSFFTPILPTADAIWYGVPDLGISPSFLHRYDRNSQTAPGIAFTLGAVLAMCELPNGNIRYVTTDGDIEEINDSLQITSVFDQDDSDGLLLNAASFSEDCQYISAGDATSQSRVYAGFVDAIQPDRDGPSSSPWRFRSRNGEPTVTAACILTPQETTNIKTLYTVLLRCDDDGVETGDDATMSAFADFLDSRIRHVDSNDSHEGCQFGGVQIQYGPTRLEGPSGLPPTADFELLSVGTNGTVQRLQGSRAIFFDSFETGDLSFWSSVSR